MEPTSSIQSLWFRKIQEYVKYLSRVEILNSLLAAEKQQVASALMEKHFSKNDVIIQQGASAGANKKNEGAICEVVQMPGDSCKFECFTSLLVVF